MAIVIQDLHIPGLLLNNYFAGDCLTVGNGVPVKEWMEKQNAQAYGTPKSLIISYEEIPKEEVIQYLACEASPIGTINGTVLHQWSQENIAQYDMATAYASDRCLLEITPKVDRDRIARLDQGAVELFFLELLIMQEAAISRVSDRVYELFYDGAFRETGNRIQTKLYDLNLEAANAVLFVNYKKLRYPVTRLSARHIGERFGVAEELEHYQNCRALLEQMIAINTAEEEKIDGDLMKSAAFIFNHGTDGSLNGESGPVSDERNIFRYRSSGYCKRCHDLPGVVWYLLADQQTGSEKTADSAGTGL